MSQTLLSIDAVASELQTSRSNVRRLWYSGLIPKPIRLGRRGIRWRANELKEFIAQRASLPQPKVTK